MSAVHTYAPGTWYALAGTGWQALLPPGATDVAATWSRVEASDDADRLTALVGASLADLAADFAFAEADDDGVRVVVRGRATVVASGPHGTTTLAGTGVRTWREELVAGARRVSLLAPGAEPGAGVLPLAAGAVLADALDVVPGGPAPVRLPEPAAHEPTPVHEPTPTPEPAPADEPDYTVLAPTQGRAPGAVAPEPSAPPPPAELEDDDGETVLSSGLAELRHELAGLPDDVNVGKLSVPGARTPPPRSVRLSTGARVTLNRPVIVGRAPSVSRVAGPALPRLVTVPSPQQDISRNHLEVRQDGDSVLVTDLRSTNGVLLRAGDRAARRLHPGVPTVLGEGDTVDLGEGVTLALEPGS